MNNTVKRKIGRAVRKAYQRKRMSDAMKASWARRRQENINKRAQGLDSLVPPLTPYGEIQHLVDILRKIMSDEELLKALKEVGRNHVKSILG